MLLELDSKFVDVSREEDRISSGNASGERASVRNILGNFGCVPSSRVALGFHARRREATRRDALERSPSNVEDRDCACTLIVAETRSRLWLPLSPRMANSLVLAGCWLHPSLGAAAASLNLLTLPPGRMKLVEA
jgi:hypothetical protein